MIEAVLDDERLLVEGAKRGNPSAFEGLVRLHQGRIRSLLAARLSNAAQIDDLAQEAFLVAYRRISTFDPSMPFYPWLKGIAQNLLRNELRRKRPRPSDDLDALTTGYAERLADTDLLEALENCIQRLESVSTRMVRARYEDGLSLVEIAGRHGKSVKAVTVALVRIRQGLRRCIEERLS